MDWEMEANTNTHTNGMKQLYDDTQQYVCTVKNVAGTTTISNSTSYQLPVVVVVVVLVVV